MLLTLPKQIKLVPFSFCADAWLDKVPDARLLADRREGISTLERWNEEPQSNVTQRMGLLKKRSSQLRLLASVMIVILAGEGLPGLSKKSVETIQAGEFIDFADKWPNISAFC